MSAIVSASVAIKGYINFMGAGRLDINTQPVTRPFGALATSANPVEISLVLASGDNTISFPAGMRGCVITLDPTSAIATKTLKGAGGDTGIIVSSASVGGTFVLLLGPAVTSFIVNASGADTGVLTKFSFF